MSRASKQRMLDDLRQLVQKSLRLRIEGANFPQLCHLQGMIDGAMRVLLDAGLASQRELLTLMAEERTKSLGPAVAVLDSANFVAA